MDINKNLSLIYTSLDLTEEQFVKGISRVSGISKKTLDNWINGYTKPQREKIKLLTECLRSLSEKEITAPEFEQVDWPTKLKDIRAHWFYRSLSEFSNLTGFRSFKHSSKSEFGYLDELGRQVWPNDEFASRFDSLIGPYIMLRLMRPRVDRFGEKFIVEFVLFLKRKNGVVCCMVTRSGTIHRGFVNFTDSNFLTTLHRHVSSWNRFSFRTLMGKISASSENRVIPAFLNRITNTDDYPSNYVVSLLKLDGVVSGGIEDNVYRLVNEIAKDDLNSEVSRDFKKLGLFGSIRKKTYPDLFDKVFSNIRLQIYSRDFVMPSGRLEFSPAIRLGQIEEVRSAWDGFDVSFLLKCLSESMDFHS